MSDAYSRREFVAMLFGAAAGLIAPWRPARAATVHPEPRPGIDARNVLTAEQLGDDPQLIGLYDGVRQIPHIVDGIRCYCGCAEFAGYRSLLTCYEEGGMAQFCEICQGQGRLAYNRSKEGQSLDQIRRAIDARYGSSWHQAHRHEHAHSGGIPR